MGAGVAGGWCGAGVLGCAVCGGVAPATGAAGSLTESNLAPAYRPAHAAPSRPLLHPAPPQQPRRALLEWALEDDRERLRDTQGIGAQRGPPPTVFERARKAAEEPQEWVRPGRFMQCLNALQQEMLERAEGAAEGSAAGSAAGSDGGDGGGEGVPSDAVLERLESVRREALQVLLQLADEGLPYRP